MRGPRNPHRSDENTALVVQPRAEQQMVVPADLAEQAARFLGAARALNTRKARDTDWAVFSSWCESRGLQALPADPITVLSFLTDAAAGTTMELRKPATLDRYLSTISVAHGAASYPSPTRDKRVTEVMDGIRRTLGTKQRQAAPLTSDVLERLLQHGRLNARDWAVLCFGQATACRRSELCALDVSNLTFRGPGVAVRIATSKTDQERNGVTLGVERKEGVLCPVLALEQWLLWYKEGEGPLFVETRSDPR